MTALINPGAIWNKLFGKYNPNRPQDTDIFPSVNFGTGTNTVPTAMENTMKGVVQDFAFPQLDQTVNPTHSFTIPTNTGTTADANSVSNTGAGTGTGSVDIKSTLRQKGNANLDELMTLYDQILSKIKSAYGDQTNRINGNYDTKIQDQTQAMNDSMYDADRVAAASNLADSSYRSTNRGKVHAAADANIKSLNDSRNSDISTIGQNANSDIAKYEADKNSIDYNRSLLGSMNNESDLYGEVNKTQTNKLGVQSDMAKYGDNGSFVAAANKLGNYDTTALEDTLGKIVGNTSATASTKKSTIDGIIDGTGLTAPEKNRLKNKYSQTIG